MNLKSNFLLIILTKWSNKFALEGIANNLNLQSMMNKSMVDVKFKAWMCWNISH